MWYLLLIEYISIFFSELISSGKRRIWTIASTSTSSFTFWRTWCYEIVTALEHLLYLLCDICYLIEPFHTNLCRVELFLSSFMGFLTSLKYVIPHLWDLLPSLNYSDLIMGFVTIVEVCYTSFMGFVTFIDLFRPHLWDLLSRWTNLKILTEFVT